MKERIARFFGALLLLAIGAGCGKQATVAETEEESDKLYTNTYIIPPNFLTSAPPGDDGGGGAPDPFAAPDPDDPPAHLEAAPRRMTSREVLESFGVEFPPGAAVADSNASSTLIVRNTEENLNLIDAVIRSLVKQAQQGLRFRLDIFEAEGRLLHGIVAESEKKADHSAAFDDIMSLTEERKAEFVTSLILDARSGQRGQVASGVSEVSYVVDFEKKDGEWMPASQDREVGTIFEADPVLGPDDQTIDLNFSLEHHFGPPSVRQHVRSTSDGDSLEYDLTEFYYARISTQLTLTAGTTRILGLLEIPDQVAGENPGRMRIALLHAEIIADGESEAVFSEKRDFPPRE